MYRDGHGHRVIPPQRMSEVQARIQSAQLETAVGAALSELLETMPPQPLVALAQNLRRAAAQGGSAGRETGDSGPAAATKRWAEHVSRGWAETARISVGGGAQGGGAAAGGGDAELLLSRVDKQVPTPPDLRFCARPGCAQQGGHALLQAGRLLAFSLSLQLAIFALLSPLPVGPQSLWCSLYLCVDAAASRSFN